VERCDCRQPGEVRWLSNGIWPAALGQPTPDGRGAADPRSSRPAGNHLSQRHGTGDWNRLLRSVITNASDGLLQVTVNAGLEGAVDWRVCGSASASRVFIAVLPSYQNSTVRAREPPATARHSRISGPAAGRLMEPWDSGSNHRISDRPTGPWAFRRRSRQSIPASPHQSRTPPHLSTATVSCATPGSFRVLEQIFFCRPPRFVAATPDQTHTAIPAPYLEKGRAKGSRPPGKSRHPGRWPRPESVAASPCGIIVRSFMVTALPGSAHPKLRRDLAVSSASISPAPLDLAKSRETVVSRLTDLVSDAA